MKYNLVLIIGTNPLPNLVVANYLLNYNRERLSTIYLIYSENNRKQSGTLQLATNLESILRNEYHDIDVQKIPLSDVSNANKIIEDLNKAKWEKSSTYHLNYTGGTKTMAVHVYQYFKENFKDLVFSYLDARNYLLLFDDGRYKPESQDLRIKVKISIEELLKLHGYSIENDSYKNEKFENVILPKFEEAIKNDTFKYFNEWYKKIRYIKAECNLEKIKNFKEDIGKEIPLNIKKIVENFGQDIPEVAKSILDAFPDEKKIHQKENGQYKLWIPDENKNISNDDFKEKVKKTWEYLDGKWLEHYVYEKLKLQLQSKGFKENRDFGWSLKAKNELEKSFELDIFIIIGYQLVAISITTESKTYIYKSNRFEVIHRARQIGGDESIAILITGLKNTTDLQNDLQINTGTTEERFKVFGIDDWKDIDKKILNFIKL